MTRGMTMVEILVSLALLALVMVGGAQWLNIAASTQTGAVHEAAWRVAAERTLELIHDSVRAGDSPTDELLERVHVVDNRLLVTTRSVAGTTGPEEHRYDVDLLTNRLVLTVKDVRNDESTRLLLDRVQEWQCAIDEEELILSVFISSSNGESVRRRIPL